MKRFAVVILTGELVQVTVEAKNKASAEARALERIDRGINMGPLPPHVISAEPFKPVVDPTKKIPRSARCKGGACD